MSISSLNQGSNQTLVKRSVKYIAVMRGWSISGKIEKAIYGRKDLRHIPWIKKLVISGGGLCGTQPCKNGYGHAWNYRWSSMHAHLSGVDPDGIIRPEKLLAFAGDCRNYLKSAQYYGDSEFERHERTGRPLGSERIIERAERLLNRELNRRSRDQKVKLLIIIKYCVPIKPIVLCPHKT